jgi:hypothetical protein
MGRGDNFGGSENDFSEREREAVKAPSAALAKSIEDRAVVEAYRKTAKMMGIGGAPTRASIIPTDPTERKKYPMATGLLFYFPDALAVVSNVSWQGNEQHNPGQPLHWARSKSADQDDTIIRHLAESGTKDTDGIRHTAKAAWRILAKLQLELEAEMRGE